LGSFLKNYGSSTNNWATFSPVKAVHLLIFTRIGLGYILGDFFTNAFGHPDGYIGTYLWPVEIGSADAALVAEVVAATLAHRPDQVKTGS
jgi:hypothetical protein